jgi:hypothetical protein
MTKDNVKIVEECEKALHEINDKYGMHIFFQALGFMLADLGMALEEQPDA